jgi:cellulose synthase/poly-beta-1,6-N-acetylglucosamine synthase-like glycosyltransferase
MITGTPNRKTWMMSKPCLEISVIIPAYECLQQLYLCLDALERQECPRSTFEVIVIDNGSMPPLQVPARPNLRMLREECVGSYAARNHGIASARGRLLAFTDADCIPARDWLNACRARIDREAEGSVIGGRIEMFYENPLAPRSVEIYDMAMKSLDQQTYIQKLGFVAPANLAIRKADFDRVGPFCADLKSSGDVEWCKRAMAAGLRLVYAEEAVVHHPARRTLPELIRRERRLEGGRCDTRLRSGAKRLTLFKEGLRQFDPRRQTFKIATFWRMGTGPAIKTRLLALVLLVQYCHALEKLRLSLGGVSRRG